ncbi:CDC48 family AAA ATPase [Candidatus Woesearchaeota archaeon]|nr:CDC48 family AAA ATPase [Candidatus Woesearchaeota archaeon]
MAKETKLKVMEALQEEAYKGIVRIDAETMYQIGVRPGDIVEIEGGRVTVGIADRAYPTDVGQAVIRMDGILRRNAKTGIGESVKVRKADVKEAKFVSIAPAQQGVMVQADPDVFKRGLLGRAIVKGDIVALGGARRRRRSFSGSPFEDIFDINIFESGFMGDFGFSGLKFVIVDATPKQPVIVTEETNIKVNPKAVEVSEEKIIDVTYEDIGGLSDEIKKIREMVEIPLRYPELFQKLGIDPPKGILLYGPPGSGKTLLAKAVANESEANFMLINGPEIMNKYYGESEKRVRDIFEEAEKNAPSIIFIDEIDAIAPKREDVHGEVERRVVAQLLSMMDGLKSRGQVVVIAATNRPNAIDPALRRPGRFDRELSVGVPDRNGRLNILKIHTRNMPIWGEVYPDLVAKSFSEHIERYLKENKLDKEKVENKVKELKNKTKDNDLLDQLISKLTLVSNRINRLEKIKNLIEDKENLEELAKELVDIYKQLELRDNDDPRRKFVEVEKDKTEQEVFKLVSEIKSLDILKKDIWDINSNLWSVIRERGKDRDIEELASVTHGFVGADLSALCKEAAMNVLRINVLPNLKLREKESIPKEVLEKLIVKYNDFKEALKYIRPSAMREVLVEIPNISWKEVGGLDILKQELKESVEWPIKNSGAFKRLGIRPPRGILLYGPPGTGKTLLAKAVAKESEANFISVKGPALLDKFVGESEKGVRKIFEKARQVAPAIIFFDEIDALAPRRGYDIGAKVTERVVNTLLAEIDGLEELSDVVVIAATNRPDILDPALLRPGRFDRLLLTIPPDEKARLEIFKIHTNKMPLAKDVDIKKLAEKTEGHVGADIESICREAAMLSLRENINSKDVKKKHFDKALIKIKPSVGKDIMEKYQSMEEEYLRNAKAAISKDLPSYLG